MTNFHNLKQITSGGIRTATGTVLSAPTHNGDRRYLIVQNLGTNPLFIKFGAGASITDFHVVLKGGNVADDGTAGFYEQKEAGIWQGNISIAGTSPRYILDETI